MFLKYIEGKGGAFQLFFNV